MGEVWLVFNTALQRLEVVKIIKAQIADAESMRDRFLTEAFLMAQVNHPNVALLYDAGQTLNGDLYLSMEYIRGQNLAEIMRRLQSSRMSFPRPLIAPIAQSVCRALDALHNTTHDGKRLELIHRDISPQNIMIDYDGRVKVLDLGVAYAPSRSGITKTDVIIGKPPYMSPEQIERRSLDARSDLFSLGSVLYELLTGERLFDKAPLRALQQISSNYGLESVDHCRTLPDGYRRILRRFLALKPEQRYRSATEAEAALFELAPESTYRAASELSTFMKSLFPKEIEVGQRELQSVVATVASLARRAPAENQTTILANHLTTLKPTSVIEFSSPPPRRRWIFALGLGFMVSFLFAGWMIIRSTTDAPVTEGQVASVARSNAPSVVVVEEAPGIVPLPPAAPAPSPKTKAENTRVRKKRRPAAKPTKAPAREASLSLVEKARRHLQQHQLREAGDVILKIAKGHPNQRSIAQCVRAALLVRGVSQMKICLSKVEPPN